MNCRNTNMQKWLDSLIGQARRQALPIMTSPGVDLLGAKPVDVFRSGGLQANVIIALAEKFPAAAAVTIMDLSIEAEAFGAPIRFSELENPTIVAPLVNGEDEKEILQSINSLAIPKVGSARTGECLIAAKISAEKITDRPTLGGLIGPFSLAGRLMDMSEFMMLTMTEPALAHKLLEKTTEFLIEYAKEFKNTGCHGLVMAEPAAGLVSPEICRDFAMTYVKKIARKVKDEQFAFVLHNCGRTIPQIPYMLDTGASAIHIGNIVDICEVLKQVPASVPVMGNIDPAGLFRRGTPENMKKAVLELLAQTKNYPNFVLSSGCDVPPGTPMENITAFYNALDEYNKSV